MRILDRYVIRELALPIFYCSFALVFLTLIADVFDNLDVMIRNQTQGIYIAQYYLSILPISFVQTISWASLLGTIYLLVHFNHHNEIIAMKAAGLGISKIVRPILFVSFLVGILTFLVSDRVVPRAWLVANNILKTKIERRDDGTAQTKLFRDVTYSSREGRLYYLGAFEPDRARVTNIIIIILDENKNIKRRLTAQSAYWLKNRWYLEKAIVYETDNEGKLVGEPDQFDLLEMPDIRETPQDFKEAAAEGEFLSYRELKGHIRKLEESGIRAYSEKADLQAKLATPWQSMIMILVAVVFLARTHKRKAIALQVLFCLTVIFSYYVLDALFMAVGKSGALPPFMSAWAANFLFGALCVLFFDRANS